MGFQNKNWSVIAYANGFTLWHYRDTHTNIEEVDESFFSSTSTLMNVGDKIMMCLKDGYAEFIVVGISGNYPKMKVWLKELTKIIYDVSEANND